MIMKYLSVIRLFEYCNIDYSVPDILKIKKIISVEYSVADKGIIAIDGFDYTKDAVLQELEQDDFSQRIKFHITVWENKDLLNFLERDIINDNAFVWFRLIDSPEFKRFISPYFAYSFNKAMQKLLRDLNIPGASSLLKFAVLVNYADENEALASTRAFISETLRLFKNTSESNYRRNYQQLNIWGWSNACLFINNLPDSLSDEADTLVIALINLTVKLQNKDKTLCLGISENLIRVNRIDPENAETIRHNHRIYVRNTSEGYKLWSIIKHVLLTFGFLIIIGVIANILDPDTDKTNKNSEKKDKTTYRYKKLYNSGSGKQLWERLIGKKDKTTSYNPYLYDITHKEFIDIRKEYTKILLDTTYTLTQNKAIPLLKNNLYYFMIENNPKKETSALRIVNRSSLPVDFYIGDEEGMLTDFVVHREGWGNPGLVEVRHSCFDIAISILDSARTKPVLEEKIIPVFISDSLDTSPRIIQTEHPDKTIHIDSPGNFYDFTIEFSSDSIFIYGKDGNKIEWIYKE